MRPFTFMAAVVLTLTACSKSEPVAEKIPSRAETSRKEEAVKQYDMRGEVIRLDPQGKIATIKHLPIGDWMGAMTMDFPVKDAAAFSRLKPGQQIRAKVYVEEGLSYWLEDVQDAPK